MKHIFTKFKKRIVSFLLIPVVSFSVGSNCYYNALASAEEALTAEAFQLVPFTWEVFTEIMVALGVGTASYWAAKDVSFRGTTLEEVARELIPEVDWFYQDMADFGQRDIPEYLDGVGGWIKSVVADGKTFLSEDVLSVFTNYAQDQGWLGGVGNSVSFPDSSYIDGLIGQQITSDQVVSGANIIGYLDSFYTSIGRSDLSTSAHNFVNSHSNVNMIIRTSGDSSGWQVWFYLVPSLVGVIINANSDNYAILNTSVRMSRYNQNSGNTYINSQGTYTTNYIPYGLSENSWGGYSAFGQTISTCFSSITSIDVPIGENGQVVDNDGAIDYPWPVPYPVDVSGVLSLPWTIPQDVAGDVIVTSPDTTIPIPLDNPAVNEGYVDWDLPTDTTQDDAQDGTYDPTESVPSESPVNPSANTFMLPNWITQRFPFCIPFDLKRGADLFASAGNEPPKWTFTLHYGLHGEHSYDVVIDMSRFNGLMSVFRIGEFILFLVGLAFVTRSILRS